MKKRIAVALLSLLAVMQFSASAQEVAVKTNLIYDATLTINAGVEARLAPKWTFDLSGNFNGWKVNEHYWKHWLIQPEARYWLCETFQGHFFATHALGGQFNLGNIHNSIKFLGSDFSKLTDRRYQGWMVGAGVAYGYSWILNRHWNIEAEFGFGYIYTHYDVYPCAKCGTKIAKDRSHNYVGPTKAAINLVYTF